MKKILLIIAVVACVAVAGTALALTQFNSATPVQGTLSADKLLVLDWGECTTGDLAIEVGGYEVYTIAYTVTKSATAPNGQLTITLANGDSPKTLDDVTIALFTDSGCTTPLKLNSSNLIDAQGTATTKTGADSIVIKGLSEDGTIYARVSVSQEATAANVGGTMTLSLVEQAA